MQDGLHIRVGEPVGSFRTSDVGNYTQDRLGGLLNTLCNSNTLSSGFYGNLIDETSTLFAKGSESILGTSSMIYLLLVGEGSPGMDIPRCLLFFQQLNGHSHGQFS